MMPVLAMAYASPKMPLPMMALLRLKTDIPKDVFPSNCSQDTTGRGCTSHTGSLPHPTPTPVPMQLLTSVKCVCFFSALWGRNSSISATPVWFSSNLSIEGEE